MFLQIFLPKITPLSFDVYSTATSLKKKKTKPPYLHNWGIWGTQNARQSKEFSARESREAQM